MAQTGATAIQLYHSSTAAAAPTAGNLADGELAINTLDEKLYFKNSTGTVKMWDMSHFVATDANGNLGLGVTPSAWNAGTVAMQVGASGVVYGGAAIETVGLASNTYIGNAGQRRIITANASTYYQMNGQHYWGVAPSAAAGTTVTFTTALTIRNDGALTLFPASTVSAPAYVNGGVYYDTTLQKLRVGGAAAWESLDTRGIITETVYAVSGTTPALSMANGSIQTWTLSGASTPTSSLTSGQSIILVITPGANTITWPSVVWTNQGGLGAAPTLYSAGKTDVILWMVGAVLYGSHLGDTE